MLLSCGATAAAAAVRLVDTAGLGTREGMGGGMMALQRGGKGRKG